MPLSRHEAEGVLRDHGDEVGTPPPVIDFVVDAVRPSARLVPHDGPHERGASRIGGTPDVADDFEWPRSERGLPLAFLMQVNLAELRAIDLGEELPPKGLLQVFFEWDPDSVPPMEEEWRLVVHEEAASLDREVAFPEDLAEENRFREFRLVPTLEWTIPAPDEVELGDAKDVALEFWDEARDLLEERQGFGPHWTPKHRMLGWPNFVQTPGMEDDARLLLQVDSDPPYACDWPTRTGMMWGDCGMIYWIADEATLRSGDFQRIRPFWECC